MMIEFMNSVSNVFINYPHQFEAQLVTIMNDEFTIRKFNYSQIQITNTDPEEYNEKIQTLSDQLY